MLKKQRIIAVSGVKNSGKTTLITKIIPRLNERGLKIATIKHDGHDFNPDVQGTDTYRHRVSGAYGTAIFSDNKWMVIKEEKGISADFLISLFPEADLILLEGFKYSYFPKIEIIRSENSKMPICDENTVIAYVSDLDIIAEDIPQFNLDEVDKISDYIFDYLSMDGR